MIPNVTIPNPIILAIPFIVSPLLGWLQDDGLPKFVNGLLAAIFILITAAACLFFGGLITSDIQADVYLYLAYAFAILNYGPCAGLRQMVTGSIPSPLLFFAKKKADVQTTQPRIPAVRPAQSMVTRAVVPPKPPSPIVLVKNPTTGNESQSG